MTTYSYTAFKITWTDTDGDNIDDSVAFGTSILKIVGPDQGTTLSYHYLSQDSDDQLVDLASNTYAQYGDTTRFDSNWHAKVTQIDWEGGHSGIFLQLEENGLSHFVLLDGDPLPNLTTLEELRALSETATISKVTSGPFGPDTAFNMADIPGISITQNDRMIGTSYDDNYNGGIGKDLLSGLAGNDLLSGGGGKDKILGGSGQDQLSGGAGNDFLKGGGGADILSGGRGNDKLFGGNHGDTFVFSKGGGHDKIVDFQDDIDRLQLNDNLWSGDLSARRVVKKFASIIDGDAVFDFGDDRLTIKNIESRSDLFDDLVII